MVQVLPATRYRSRACVEEDRGGRRPDQQQWDDGMASNFTAQQRQARSAAYDRSIICHYANLVERPISPKMRKFVKFDRAQRADIIALSKQRCLVQLTIDKCSGVENLPSHSYRVSPSSVGPEDTDAICEDFDNA